MSNELLDFKARENFNFLCFSGRVNEEKKESFKEGCETVLNYAHVTVRDLCCLGLRLQELRDSDVWKDVINPRGNLAFRYQTFADFCDYAFGFSKTKTSNILRMAQYVTKKDEEVCFIDERYKDFNTSQLVELASVDSIYRSYFSPEMTVQEIRMGKEYIVCGLFCLDRNKSDFDFMTYAKAYFERRKNRDEEIKAHNDAVKKHFVETQTTSGVLPGQVAVEEVCEPVPTSDLAEDGDEVQNEVLIDEKLEEIIKKCLIDLAGDNCRRDIYETYKNDLPPSTFVEFVKDQYVYGSGGFKVLNLDVSWNFKGYHIIYGANDIFLTWATVTSYIVSYINRGEYYAEPKSDEVQDEPVSEVVAPIDVVGEVEEKSKYDFSTRSGVRAFLADYNKWTWFAVFSGWVNTSFVYRFKNGISLYAIVENVCSDISKMTSEHIVRYYLQDCFTSVDKYFTTMNVTKEQLEKFITSHQYEL